MNKQKHFEIEVSTVASWLHAACVAVVVYLPDIYLLRIRA